VIALLICAWKLCQLLEKAAISVRDTIGEEYLVVLVVELVLEGKATECSSFAPFVDEVISKLGLAKGYIVGILLPRGTSSRVFLFGKDVWLHTLIFIDLSEYFQVKVVVLADVADIQLHAFSMPTVSYREVVPQGMSSCV